MITRIVAIIGLGICALSCATTEEIPTDNSKPEKSEPKQSDLAVGPGEIALAYKPKSEDTPTDPSIANELPTQTKVAAPSDNAKVEQVSDDPIIEESSAEDAALPVEEAAPPATNQDYVVSAEALNVRSGPGMQFEPIRVLKKGTKVTMLDREGIWVRIGPEEFVSIKHLSDGN